MMNRRWLAGAALWLVVGCGGSSSGSASTGGSSSYSGAPSTGGSGSYSGAPSTGGSAGEDEAALRGELTAVGNYSQPDLAAHYPASFQNGLGYEPRDSLWLERIQASSLALNDQELSALSSRGFTISDRLRFPDYFYGYKTLYFEHLPLFVSADSVLYAVHRSYDSLLAGVEYAALEPKLKQLLRSLRSRLASAAFPASTTQDLGLSRTSTRIPRCSGASRASPSSANRS